MMAPTRLARRNNMTTFNGVICGGVVSETEFHNNPWAYMMMRILPDEYYQQYMKADELGQKLIIKKHGWSAIG